MIRNPVTPEGHAELTQKLKHRKSVERLQIVRDIEEARAHGDISENSEFEDAKQRQAECDAHIRRLESVLATAEIIDITKVPAKDRVIFGCWVTIENTATGEERQWRVVGEDQADVEARLISYRSPIASALIGKSEGDEVTVPTPQGKVTFEVVEIHYGREPS